MALISEGAMKMGLHCVVVSGRRKPAPWYSEDGVLSGEEATGTLCRSLR